MIYRVICLVEDSMKKIIAIASPQKLMLWPVRRLPPAPTLLLLPTPTLDYASQAASFAASGGDPEPKNSMNTGFIIINSK
jgi:hypothetical protein